MTAIVGILNKRAVAVATDSAVTIDCQSGHKVLNSARKLFQLSKKEPVGIMIYSSANFMETPWELIISLYREHLGDSAYDSLQEYVDDFVVYFDQFKYTTHTLDNIYDGFDLRDIDFDAINGGE